MPYLLLLLFLLPLSLRAACEGVWTGASGLNQNWGTLGNWSSCIPQTQDDSALFPFPTSATSVNVDISPTLSFLTFDSSASYTLSGAGTLTFLNTTSNSPAAWRNLLGEHFLNVPIELDNTTLQLFLDDHLTIQNTVIDLGVSSVQLSGSLINSDNSLFSLNGDLTLLSGAWTNVNTTVGMTLSMDNLLLQGGLLTSTNHRNVSGSNDFGILMEAASTFTFSSGSAFSINQGNISGLSNAGSQISASLGTISGSLTLRNTGTIAGSLAVGSSLQIATSLQVEGGVLILDNQGTVTNGTGCRVSTDEFTLDGGTVILQNSGHVQGTFATGAILSADTDITINSGLLVNGASVPSTVGVTTLVISPNISLNGGTFINRSIVRGDTLSIANGATLAGSGTFIRTNLSPTIQITSSGTLTPGEPSLGGAPASMIIGGTYTQNPSGTFLVNFLNPDQFSRLRVIQTAQIAGNLEIGFTPGVSILPGQTFTILEALEGLSGTFNDPQSSCFLVPHVQYLPNSVLLSFTPTMCNYVGKFTETILSSINQNNLFLTLAMERIRERSLCLSQECPLPCDLCSCSPAPGRFYIGPVGNFGNTNTQNQQIGFDYWSLGVKTGADYAFSHSGIGFLTQYERISANGDQNWGSFHIDQLHASLYGSLYPDRCRNLAFNAILGGSYEWYSFERNLSPFPQDAQGTPHGFECDALLGSEYTFRKGCSQLIPFLSLQYMYLHVSKYQEYNAETFALEIEHQQTESLRSTLGLRANHTWVTKSANVTCEGSLGWQREFLDTSRSIRFRPLYFAEPTQSFSVPESARNILIGGVDLLIDLCNRHSLEANYNFDWSSDYQDNFFYLGWNVKF